MRGLFLLALLCFSMYQCALGDMCGCGVRHPQVRYCTADFAMLVQIQDRVEANLPFTPDRPGPKDYVRFNVSVLQVFKPTEIETDLVILDTVDVWTSIGLGFCGKPDLELLEEYVISGDFGSVVDPETGERYFYLVFSRCDIYYKMDTLSNYQMEAFTGGYDQYCNSGCEPNDVYGVQQLREYGALETQILPIESLTKYWSLDLNCYYNPVASVQNLVDDCESMYSICRSDPETQQCGWDLNPRFMECFKNRGLAVSYRTNPNAAAIRRPSDCKYLSSKKLKKRCLRKLKKAYKKELLRKQELREGQ